MTQESALNNRSQDYTENEERDHIRGRREKQKGEEEEMEDKQASKASHLVVFRMFGIPWLAVLSLCAMANCSRRAQIIS